MKRICFLLPVLFLALLTPAAMAQDRNTRVHTDRKEFADDESWIYNDLSRGLSEAKKTGKPLLIVFR